MGDDPADLVWLNDAARELGRHPETVRRWVRDGRLQLYRRAGQREVYLRRAELQQLLENPPLLPKRGRPSSRVATRGGTGVHDVDVTQIDGPHDPERTSAAARLAADALRYLNYATRDDAPGIAYPGDVYTVLGFLGAAVSRLRQTVSQLNANLDRQLETGRLRIDPGAPYEDDPGAGVRAAGEQLERAAASTREVEAAIGEAQRIISGMSLSRQ